MRCIYILLLFPFISLISACGTMPVPNAAGAATVVAKSGPDVSSKTAPTKEEKQADPAAPNLTGSAKNKATDQPPLNKSNQTVVASVLNSGKTLDQVLQQNGINVEQNKQQTSPGISSTPKQEEATTASTKQTVPKSTPGQITKQGLSSPEPDKTEIVAQKSKSAEKSKQKAANPVSSKSKDKRVTTAMLSARQGPSEDDIKYSLANRYLQSGKYQNAIDVLETGNNGGLKNIKLRDLLVLSYTRYARELAGKADLLEAQTVLEKAVNIEPKNKTIRQQLQSVKNIRESNKIYKTALDSYNSGNQKSAFESFRQVLTLNPKHKKAKKYYEKIKSVVVDEYHKRALQFYRRQELSAAIKQWNQLLEVDPGNDLARIYRSRAIELKRKFDRL